MTKEESLKGQDVQESKMPKPVLENERVRVLKVVIKPGEKTVLHSHPDTVICMMNDQKVKFASSDKEEEEVDLNFGQVLYFKPLTHTVENIGETDAISIVIELKK
jgi:quercetin dioxygenase-like cupin family protein